MKDEFGFRKIVVYECLVLMNFPSSFSGDDFTIMGSEDKKISKLSFKIIRELYL